MTTPEPAGYVTDVALDIAVGEGAKASLASFDYLMRLPTEETEALDAKAA